MLGIPLSGLGIGITLWKPVDGQAESFGNDGLLQEDGVLNFVLLELDGDFVFLED